MWQECAHFTKIRIFRCYGYTRCMFCSWPPQNLQTGPSQIGQQIPQSRAHDCGSCWRFRFVCPMAWDPSWVERTRIGMCRTSWRQVVVPEICLEQYWKLANYIANLPDNRWLKRALAWTTGRAKIGRPRNTWDSQIQMHCRWKCLGEWSTTAMLTDVWLAHIDSLVEFSSPK